MIARDLLWKGIINSLVDDFLAFFFPEATPLFDLDRGVEFLDSELIQIFPDAQKNQRYVDRLIKVYLKDGSEKYFLVHVEVQGYVDRSFSERMFIYFYRLYERYKTPITALAIFTDDNLSFHPKEFSYHFLGTQLIYRFRTYKLMEKVYEELERFDNPFAIVMEAARMTLDKSLGYDEAIYENKFRLVRKLIDKGYEREKIRTILSFIVYYQPFFESKMSRKFEENLNVMDATKGLVELIKEEMIRQNREAGRMEGLEEGRAEGLEEGRAEGLEEGRAEGLEEGRADIIKRLIRNGFGLPEIANITNIPLSELQQIVDRFALD